MRFFFVLIYVLPILAFGQKLKKDQKQTVKNLREHVYFLASDELEGRRAGSVGEEKAVNYISSQFRKYGLKENGTNGFVQPFKIDDGKGFTKGSFIEANGNVLSPIKDFFTLYNTGNCKLSDAFVSVPLAESGSPWFLDLGELIEENKDNPHFDLNLVIKDKIKNASSKGATILFLFNPSLYDDNLRFEPKDKSEAPAIPVIYIKKESWKKYFAESKESIELKLNIQFEELYRTGHNVIGFLDNHAEYTVILGAHFDHLGYGEDGNSMIRNGDPAIHNGADDNASGSAALIELSRLIKKSKISKYNFLFTAFSAEELGLNGSKYFVDNAANVIKQTSFMINMDMVGRLNDSLNTITIGGFGTSPKWGEVLNKQLKSPFVIKIDSSGSGPSDHTSFYRKDIPVLFFFTGLHSDYHKPSDDADKINFFGQLKIIEFIVNLIRNENINGKLEFRKTREQQTGNSTRFTVSLGVMPDYTFSGFGVRIDGVSEGKLAQKIGLKAGDILVKLGDYELSSVETYMKALSKFKKGDKTILLVKRNQENLNFNIQF